MCMMISAAGIEIVRLQLKFYNINLDFYKLFHKQCSDEGLW